MKKTKTNRTTTLRTLLSLLLLTVLMISCFYVTASATPPIDDGDNSVQWIFINAEHTKLDGDGVVYEKLDLPAGCELFELADRYVYMNSVRAYATGGGYIGDVFAAEKDGYLVCVDFYDGHLEFYCRTDMLSKVQAYLKGESGQYVLRAPEIIGGDFSSSDGYHNVEISFAETILSAADTSDGQSMLVDVTRLKESDIMMELRLQDESGLLTTVLGAIYTLPNGIWGFVDYRDLSNNFFDADGHFSYRQGEVQVHFLDENEDFTSELKKGADGSYNMSASYTYEYNEYEQPGIIGGADYTDNTIIAAFWVVFVMVGYLLPIAPLTIGLVFALSPKRMSHPKRWFLVVGLAALWILLAVVLTVLLLL